MFRSLISQNIDESVVVIKGMLTFWRRLWAVVCLSALTAPALAISEADYQADWSTVLAEYVNEQGQIDFVSLAKQSEPLQAYVTFIGKVSPASHSALFPLPEDVLAYHLNAYNALAMWGVIERKIPEDFDSFFKRLRFFKLRTVVVGNVRTSLYDYENDVIRKLNEPRVHFALNCMVKDCPRLPQRPFKAEMLTQQLTELTQSFFNTPKHLRINDAEQAVYVSEILDFYTEDFVASGDADDLLPYIQQHYVTPIPKHYRVKFMDYDWAINQQP